MGERAASVWLTYSLLSCLSLLGCPGDDLALLPFIDLMNHQQHADTPQQ